LKKISVFLTAVIIVAIIIAGCVSTQTKDVFLKEKITGPKIIAMSGTRAPWVYEIEKRLRKNGFKIKRMASQNVAVEQVSPTKTEAYNEASARFILNIDGYAPNTSMTRCFGGGYRFKYINAELIDVRTNETVLHYSNSGYSENCPPLSGTIFTDITQAVTQVWE
jgi:hypothetical protein